MQLHRFNPIDIKKRAKWATSHCVNYVYICCLPGVKINTNYIIFGVIQNCQPFLSIESDVLNDISVTQEYEWLSQSICSNNRK